MARRFGSDLMPLSAAEKILRAQRKDTWDTYLPIDAGELLINDSLAPVEHRFRLRFRQEGKTYTCRLTQTSLDQICGCAGIPSGVVDRIPAVMVPRLHRVLLEGSMGDRSRMKLMRLRGTGSRVLLRAVLTYGRVRITDQEVYEALLHVIGDEEIRLSRVIIDEDSMFLRANFPNRMNVGGSMRKDEVLSGIDVLSSETGRYSLQVRHCLLRLVCENGMTHGLKTPILRLRGNRFDRGVVENALRISLQAGVSWGREAADQLAETRSQHLADPLSEMHRIFDRFRLGSLQGKLAAWIRAELQREINLLGARRFDVIQAFTAVARGLEHRDRTRLEDAMGDYLMSPGMRN